MRCARIKLRTKESTVAVIVGPVRAKPNGMSLHINVGTKNGASLAEAPKPLQQKTTVDIRWLYWSGTYSIFKSSLNRNEVANDVVAQRGSASLRNEIAGAGFSSI
jgi:hypothetical protein